MRRFDRGGETRSALVLPGMGYVPAAPYLYYARLVLQDAGYAVVEVWWELPDEDLDAWLVESAREALGELPSPLGLVVAKSIGTRALALVDPPVPGIWLTPLLRRDYVAETLERRGQPDLIVGGTADETFPLDVAQRLRAAGKEVLVIEGGDHSLDAADAEESIRALARTVEAMQAFVSEAGERAAGP